MDVIYYHEPGTTMTREQIQNIREAAEWPITYDEDCPESTPEMLEAFHQAAIERNRRMTPEQREAFRIKVEEYRKRQDRGGTSPTIA